MNSQKTLFATNSFHGTQTPVTILETALLPDCIGEKAEYIRAEFDMNALCGMDDCTCYGCNQRPDEFQNWQDDHLELERAPWYLKSSFDVE